MSISANGRKNEHLRPRHNFTYIIEISFIKAAWMSTPDEAAISLLRQNIPGNLLKISKLLK